MMSKGAGGFLTKSCFDCWTTLDWLIDFCFPEDHQKKTGFQDDFGGMVAKLVAWIRFVVGQRFGNKPSDG